MISVNVPGTGGVVTRREAKRWLARHVVIERAALKKIARLCRRHGIFAELKALEVEMLPLGPGKGGSW